MIDRALTWFVLALVLLAVAGEVTVARQHVALLSTRETLAQMTTEQRQRLQALLKRPLTPVDVSVFRGRPTPEYLKLLQPNTLIEIELPSGAGSLSGGALDRGGLGQHLVTFNRGFGRFLTTPNGLDGYVVLTEGSKRRYFLVTGVGDRPVAVAEVGLGGILGHGDPDGGTVHGTNPPTTVPACSTDKDVTVLVLAMEELGLTEAAIQTAAADEIERLQRLLKNSALTGTVTLAGAHNVKFTRTESMKHDTEELAIHAGARALRAKTGGDLVILITNHPAGGWAHRLLASHDTAFAMLSGNNAGPPYFSLAHEFGHLLGAGHEPEQQAHHKDFPHGVAYVSPHQNKWYSVMADPVAGPREMLFSNPGVMWEFGTNPPEAAGSATVNNAAVVQRHLPFAARFNCAS